jgi:hypothetical protein
MTDEFNIDDLLNADTRSKDGVYYLWLAVLISAFFQLKGIFFSAIIIPFLISLQITWAMNLKPCASESQRPWKGSFES